MGGVCAVVVGHPFDLVKVRLQTAEKGVYKGAMDVVRRTVAREGLARVFLFFVFWAPVAPRVGEGNEERGTRKGEKFWLG